MTDHTALNIRLPRALRAGIDAARAWTGESTTAFIRAAIVDRLLKLRGMEASIPPYPRDRPYS